MMKKNFTRVLVMSLLTMSAAAFADDTGATTDTAKPADTAKTTAPKTKPAKLKQQELQVMAHYHAVNQLEIDLGKAAAKKATSDAVKTYGTMLVKDHQDADNELLTLAKKTGQMIPREKPADDAEKKEMADDKAAAAKLKTLKGADFEREYLRMMVQGHEKELAKIDTNIAKAENAELIDSLKAKKPVLQHHADEARSLQKAEPTSMNDTATPPPATAKR
jgi:putative membrane protein